MATLSCPECKMVLPSLDRVAEVCPRCGASLATLSESQDWVPIARVANLAEAGFMADYLAGNDLESDIVQQNEFNAAAGAWQTSFVVQVVPAEAVNARRILTTGEYGEEEGAFSEDWSELKENKESSFLVQAVKLVLVLLVLVGATYFIVEVQRKKPQRNQPGEPETLHEFLNQQPGPWIYQDESGVQSQLYYNAAENRMTLQQDLDGDGVPDYRKTFQTR